MISAGNDLSFAFWLLEYRICPMAADVVKGVDFSFSIFHEKELESCNFIQFIRSHIRKAKCV